MKGENKKTFKKNFNILICSGGKRVDLIKEFRRALNGRGRVVITDANDLNAGRFFADDFFKAPRLNDKNYLSFIKKIIKENQIKILFSVIDPELLFLVKYKKELEGLGAKVLISSLSSVETTNDKRKTAKFFQKIKILTPKIFKFNEVKKYPVFIKPYDGNGSKFAYCANNFQELDTFSRIVPNPIITEFIPGQEYTIDCLSDFSGEIINVIPRKRLEVNNGIAVKSVVDLNPAIISDAKKILKALKVEGPATIQLIKSPAGKRYFTEVNLRFGGGVMLGIKSGGNFPGKIINMLGGKQLKFSNNSVKDSYSMVAYLDHQFYYEKN